MAVVYKRPGAYITESVLPITVQVADSPSVGAFIAPFQKGATTGDPVVVTSWAKFVSTFGDFNASYPGTYAAYLFFLNGGSTLVVNRVAGAAAVAASRTFVDRAGTPLATVKFSAKNVGTWGNSIYVEIADNASDATLFDVVVYYGGNTSTKVVETFTGVSLVTTHARYIVPLINQTSDYVTVTDLLSATNAPTGNSRPAVKAAVQLGGGTVTGNESVTAGTDVSPVASDYTNALSRFDVVQVPMDINAPAVYDTTILDDIIAYAHNRGDCFVVVDSQSGRTVAEATTYSGSVSTAVKGMPNLSAGSSNAAIYYPWITIPDPSATVVGQTRTIAPGGAVLGLIGRTDKASGPFKTPAGIGASLYGVVAPEKSLTASELDTLNSAAIPVNALRVIPGAGICVMGGRTLLPGGADRYVNIRRSLIHIRSELDKRLSFAAFENNDAHLWQKINTVVKAFLTSYWQSGGLRGDVITDAFFVRCDASNNTPASIANGEVRVEVGVSLQYPAEFIVITLSQTTTA